MKKTDFIIIAFWIILIIGVLLEHPVKAQQVVIKYPGYTSYWNSKNLIPDSVIWLCMPHKKAVGRESGFHSTGGRQNLDRDYAKSGYDIGHNCDASDENGNKTDEFNSFDYVNTFPQRPNNNRITWLALENQTRIWAKQYGRVKVRVTSYGKIGKMGKDSVLIPEHTVKEVWYNGIYAKYDVPNRDTVNKHPFTYYKVK